MKIQIKAQDDEGNTVLEGKLNQKELDYLIQFGINGLMAMGAQFMLSEEDEGESRIRFGDTAH